MTTELITINAYDEYRNQIDVVKEACNHLPSTITTEGYEKAKRVSLDVGKILTALDKKRKEIKAESIATGKAIDSEAKTIREQLEELQEPHKLAYKKLDAEKKQRDIDRKVKLELRVADISGLPAAMADSDAAGIKMAMESLAVEECEDFYEYTAEALKARNASKTALADMFATKLKQEKDAKELAELRAKQAEQDQKDCDERIAKEAADAANREAEAAKAAAQAAIEAAALAVKQREEAEIKAKADAAMAKEEAERAAEEAQNSMALAGAIAKKQAETAAINARNKAILEQEAKEAAELAEQVKREANNRHVGGIRKAAKESLMDLGIDEKLAKTIVMAIHDEKIANVSIKY